MTLDRGLRPTSPVHVHVDDSTPVHVHMMKRAKKPKPFRSPGSHRLDVPPQDHGELSTEEEDAVHGQMRQYEDKIDTLMSHVGTLKNEVDLQRALHELDAKDHMLDTSHRTIEKQEATLKTIESELTDREHENYLLRKSVDITKYTYTTGPPLSREELEELDEDMKQFEQEGCPCDQSNGAMPCPQSSGVPCLQNDVVPYPQNDVVPYPQNDVVPYPQNDVVPCPQNVVVACPWDDATMAVPQDRPLTEKELLNREREQLMKKLIEVEMDGQAAQQYVRDLRDVIRRLREDNRMPMSSAESLHLSKLKEAFFEKMADFEATNRALRRLLREHHRSEGEAARLMEQREVLLKKVADGDAYNERLRLELQERDLAVDELRGQVLAQREESVALGNLQDSLETTRAHLQKQLRTKEADCNRMAVQIRTLEGQLAQNKIEMDHLQDLVNTAKQRADGDKEALKKATRAQKQRAERGEGEAERLRGQLMEREGQVNDLQAQLSVSRSRLEKDGLQREHAEAQRNALQKRVEELETLVDRVEGNSKSQVESLTARLHEKSTEVTTLKLENERLKSTATSTETRLKTLEEEAAHLRSNLKSSEQLVDEYKGQMDRSRREADESMVMLDEQQREASRLQQTSEMELEKVKVRLHQRLQELEPLPELLRTTELRLHEANEKLLQYERRNSDNTKLIAELTAKVESRGEAVDGLRQKFSDSQEESRLIQGKVENCERRIKELDDANKELTNQVARKEEAMHQLNLRLEEKGRESGVLTRQLENALTDLRQQQDNARDRFASKERTYQSRVVDLESQLSQLRAEIARIKREKEENERKFNSRLFDLKDRLEQCHSTNRSMQNYVQFLKNSYANVFGETAPYGPTPLKHPLP